MLCKKLYVSLITLAYVEASNVGSVGERLHRNRRQGVLLWPNSTLLQFNVGVGTPTLAKNINMNYAFQANFQLPWNRTQIPTDVLVANSGLMTDSRRRRDVYEDDAKLMHFYKYVEDVLNGYNHDGKSCVLQTLCQVGAEPLHCDDEDDILHEIAAFVLNPTHDADENLKENDDRYPYIEAYRNGQNSKDCNQIYHKCKMPLVDMFTKLNHDVS